MVTSEPASRPYATAFRSCTESKTAQDAKLPWNSPTAGLLHWVLPPVRPAPATTTLTSDRRESVGRLVQPLTRTKS